jgi:hypothetical protein
MNKQLHEIVLRKEGQTYVFRFDDASHQALLGVLGRFAVEPSLNFSWHDAAVVCKKTRQPCANSVQALPPPSVNRLA